MCLQRKILKVLLSYSYSYSFGNNIIVPNQEERLHYLNFFSRSFVNLYLHYQVLMSENAYKYI